MHQQIPPLDQCGITSQMAQPIVICPFQLVYDAHRQTPMVVQRNEDQIRIPHPLLLNVQNTPPWIQNPTQNVIYVQQTPNQILPYLQPNMMQNPIYQTPYNFPQIIPQESITPMMQIPTLIQNDTVQNQPVNINYPLLHENMTQNPMININYNEKMPVVAQNQINATLKAEMRQLNQLNNIAGTKTMPNQTQNQNISTATSEIKQNMAQNQVNTISNTEILTNVNQIQNIPKDKMPILTHLLNKNPSEIENKPFTQNQHVQTDFPIPKTNTVTNPGLQYISINNTAQNNDKTNGITQLNPIDTKQDHKASNFYNQRHIRPIRPNITKNSEVPLFIKSNIQDTMNVRTIYRPILPKPVRPNEIKGSNFVNPTFVTLRAPNPVQAITSPNRGVMTNYTLINEGDNTKSENTNKVIEIHNIKSMSGGKMINRDMNINEMAINTQDFVQNIEISVSDKLTEDTVGNKLNLISIEEIYIQEYEGKKYNKPIQNKVDQDNELHSNLNPINKSYIDDTQTHIKEKHEEVDREKEIVEQENQKVDQKEKNGHQTKKKCNLDKNKSIVNKDDEKRDIPDRIFILTHVLDGHVIQESNVAFPIHKPLKEKISYEPYESDTPDWKNEVEPLLPLKYLHIIDNDNQTEEDTELEIEDVEDVNPFLNLMKSTVEEWNMDQLSSHLIKHNWKETATKLREQEIDGESLLLVSDQQLIYIGVSEQHAELITEFINKCN